MRNVVALKIILDLWEIEKQVDKILEPARSFWGNMTYNKIDDINEMQNLINIWDREKKLKKALRSKIGFRNYVKYLINPVKFTQSL